MRFQMYKDTGGHYRWRLRSTNNKIIANSGEGYLNKEDCLEAIKLVRHSGLAELEDQTAAAA